MSTLKKLANKFVFWYHIIDNSSSEDYKAQIKKLAEFDTLEDFWAIFQYLKKPDDYKQPVEMQLFKEGIKPMWEDENNKNGGKIALKLRKEYSNLVWEELVFAFIGGYLAKEIKDEINGLVINCKKDFNTLQIWTKSFSDEVTSGIEKNIRDILNIPNEVVLEIKPFNMQHKEYNNNYNNYNNYNYNNNYNYKGNYNKKRQNNNYYKKNNSYENSGNYKYNENKEGNKTEKEIKENNEENVTDKGKKEDEKVIEKKDSIEDENPKEKEKDKEKEKESFKEVKKKKKKKVDK